MKVLLCESANSPLRSLAEIMDSTDDLSVVAVSRTGRETIDILNSGGVDIAIHSDDTVALASLIRPALLADVSSSVRRIVASATPSAPLVVRAHQFGFDGLVPFTVTPAEFSLSLLEILSGRSSLADHPIVRRLGLTAGMIDRTLVYASETESQVADLLGVGLNDDEIADALSISIQVVRNTIASIIHANELRTRTQLSVLHAVNVPIPDFTR